MVLENKLDVTDSAKLARVEDNITSSNMLQ